MWVTAGVYKSERWVASGLDPPWMLLSSAVCLSGFRCPSRPLQPWPTDTQVKALRVRERALGRADARPPAARATFELGGRRRTISPGPMLLILSASDELCSEEMVPR